MSARSGADRPEVRLLAEALGPALLKVKEFRGDTFVCVARERLLDTLELLKTSDDLKYDYFSECTAVDYSRWGHERDLPNRFEVIYNLMSVSRGARIFVKIGVDEGQSVQTAKHLFLGADYPEKEVGDMFGIVFEGNELVGERFMMPDDWVGFPLRKEYPLGGEDVFFDTSTYGPAVEDISMPHAGESFEGKTGTEDVGGR